MVRGSFVNTLLKIFSIRKKVYSTVQKFAPSMIFWERKKETVSLIFRKIFFTLKKETWMLSAVRQQYKT